TDRELPYNASQRPTLSMLDARRGGTAVLTQAPNADVKNIGAVTPEDSRVGNSWIVSPIFPMVRSEPLDSFLCSKREEQAVKLLELESKLEDIAKTSPDPRESEAYMWVATTCYTRDPEGMERELLWRLPQFEHASDGRRLVTIGFMGAIGHRSLGAYRALVSAVTSPRSLYELEEALLVSRTHATAFRGEAAGLLGEAVLFSLHSGNILPGTGRSHFCKVILHVYFSRSLYAKIGPGVPIPKELISIVRNHRPRKEALSFLEDVGKYSKGELDMDQMRRSILELRASKWYREFRMEVRYAVGGRPV
ncbi:hypothetical protein, partial [Streptomyces sp. NPDC002520]